MAPLATEITNIVLLAPVPHVAAQPEVAEAVSSPGGASATAAVGNSEFVLAAPKAKGNKKAKLDQGNNSTMTKQT